MFSMHTHTLFSRVNHMMLLSYLLHFASTIFQKLVETYQTQRRDNTFCRSCSIDMEPASVRIFFTIPQSHDLTAFHNAVNGKCISTEYSSHTIPLFKSYPMHCTFFFKPSQSLVFIKSTRKDGEAIWPEAIWAMCL